MKTLLYAPLLIGALLTLYALAKAKPLSSMWPPMLALNLCAMMASGPKSDWWIVAIGGFGGVAAVFYFYRLFGVLVVGSVSLVASVVVLSLPEYHFWFLVAFIFAFVSALFSWALAVRKSEKGKADEGLWK